MKSKEFIRAYKGYVVRRFGPWLIAIPKDAKCYAHRIEVDENLSLAFKRLKEEL